MKRIYIEQLIKWNQTEDIRPVMLTGAKGVGKTYLAYDFAKAFFKNILYLNFEHDPKAVDVFSDKDPGKLSKRLSEHFYLTALDSDDNFHEDRLLILDEISYCPAALHMLSSLQQEGAFPRIIAISSSPLKKEELKPYYHIPIYPMQFNEFLTAIGSEWYIETIIAHYNSNKKIPDIVHKELLNLHNLYLQIGGMPSIINEYLNFNNISNIPEQHSHLMGTYRHYLSLLSSDSESLKMNQVLDCLPLQLLKSNKKFQYNLIRKGTTHAMYKEAIQSLSNQNYIIPCYKMTTKDLSNIDKILEEDRLNVNEITSFKLYLSDAGLLHSLLLKEIKTTFNKVARKALLENYIATTLKVNGYPIVFWESESTAKIDFLLSNKGEIIPLEIFCDTNTRSKSISVLKQKIDFPYSIKISERNFEYSNNVKYVPYYAAFCI